MYITVQELKDFINVKSEAEDDYFGTLITQAQDMMSEEYPKLRESANYTEDFHGDDTDMVVLNHVPVTAVSEVLSDIDSATAVLSTNYVTHNNSGLLKLKSGIFPWGFGNCRVVYTAGYTPSTVPGAAKQALLQLCSMLFSESGRSGESRLGKQSINSPDGGTVSFVHQLPPHTQRALSRYKDIRF